MNAPATENAAEQFLAPTDMLGYMRRLFEPGDYIDIKLIHESKKFTDKNGVIRAETRDNFQPLETALRTVHSQPDSWVAE